MFRAHYVTVRVFVCLGCMHVAWAWCAYFFKSRSPLSRVNCTVRVLHPGISLGLEGGMSVCGRSLVRVLCARSFAPVLCARSFDCGGFAVWLACVVHGTRLFACAVAPFSAGHPPLPASLRHPSSSPPHPAQLELRNRAGLPPPARLGTTTTTPHVKPIHHPT